MKQAVMYIILLGCWMPGVQSAAPENTVDLSIGAADPGRIYAGIGAVSAGGNTCLLMDYPEPFSQ